MSAECRFCGGWIHDDDVREHASAPCGPVDVPADDYSRHYSGDLEAALVDAIEVVTTLLLTVPIHAQDPRQFLERAQQRWLLLADKIGDERDGNA